MTARDAPDSLLPSLGRGRVSRVSRAVAFAATVALIASVCVAFGFRDRTLAP